MTQKPRSPEELAPLISEQVRLGDLAVREAKMRNRRKAKKLYLKRLMKANADWWRDAWLRDHPGKTLADYEIAGSCADTEEGYKEYGEWAMALMKPQQGQRQ